MGVVCDKQIPGKHLLHHWVSSALNINDSLFIDCRADIVISLRHKGKAAEYIQLCHSLGGLLDPLHLPGHGIPDPAEYIIL